jgi:hypothetical protein
MMTDNIKAENKTLANSIIKKIQMDIDNIDNLNIDDIYKITNDFARKMGQLKQAKEAEARAREDAEHKQKISIIKRRELPADWVNAFSGDERTEGLHVENAGDGLLLSLNHIGRVDIEYIAQVN